MSAVRGQTVPDRGGSTTAGRPRADLADDAAVPQGDTGGRWWGAVTALLGLHLLLVAARHALPPWLGWAAAVTGAVLLLAASPRFSHAVRRHLGRVEVTVLTGAGLLACAAVVVTVLLAATTGLRGYHPTGRGWSGPVAVALAASALLVHAVGLGLEQRHLAWFDR